MITSEERNTPSFLTYRKLRKNRPRSLGLGARQQFSEEGAATGRFFKEDALIEHAEYASGYYGFRKSALDALRKHQSVIFEIDVQGKNRVVQMIPNAVTIFIKPPSIEELRKRLEARGTEIANRIALRWEQAKSEIAASESCQYCITNDDVDNAY